MIFTVFSNNINNRVMLSDEGNENGEKTTIVLISEKQFCTCSTLFCTFFALVLHDHNVKLPGYSLYGGNIVRVLVPFFHGHSFSPWWRLAFLCFPPTATSCCASNQKCLLCLLSLALAVCRSFSRWASLASRFSVSLFLCIPNLWTRQLM